MQHIICGKEAEQMNPETKNALTAFLEDKEHLPVYGNALLVCQDGRELYRHYTGSSEKDTLYRIYSMTKPVTVTCAMQLWEKGLLGLDDPLYKYMPAFQQMTVWDKKTKTAVPAKKPVLIRDLICMTAGFTYGGDEEGAPRLTNEKRGALEEKYPDEAYTTQQFISALADVPLAFEPGTHWNYSLCHDVLGALIEVISGQTLGEYMREHIFAPLHMEDTFFRCPDEKRSRLAQLDKSKAADMKFGQQARYESGGGGLLSTLDDYMTFALTLTRGGISEDGTRILKNETIDLIRQDHLTPEQKKDFNWDYLHGYSYGLGMRTLVSPGTDGIPGSLHEFGWCGVLGTWVLMDPERHLTAVYMHQRYPNLEKYVQLSLRPLIYDLIKDMP